MLTVKNKLQRSTPLERKLNEKYAEFISSRLYQTRKPNH